MNILILSVSAGGGHNNAAQAIAEYAKKKDPSSRVLILDAYKEVSPFLDKIIIGSYLQSLKVWPKAFQYLYQASDTQGGSIKSMMNLLDQRIASRLLPTIRAFDADILVATHPFTAHVLSLLLEEEAIDSPCLTIMTDYGAHALWVHPHIDNYVVAHEAMIPELMERGRSRDSILPLGIPVKSSFLVQHPRELTLKKLHLNPKLPTVSLMGGSLALGNLRLMLRDLLEEPMPFNVLVFSANDLKFRKDAQEIAEHAQKPVAVLPYENSINAFLQATDLLITKPGGLTITEALICGVPMALFSAIPGQEEQNLNFLLRHNLGLDLGEGENCGRTIADLLAQPEKRAAMKARALSFARPQATQAIYQQMQRLVDEGSERGVQKKGGPERAHSLVAPSPFPLF
ncbi:putative 1,2-diacylglycerol 3-glucosyltransferase [Clostridiaceae bacterium JG1575]|nr:putative 1,2-diacylglycerol 3-glucosyltransferase [Clostridiaceae bacterium JG1575]